MPTKSHALNLYSNDSGPQKHFKITPLATKTTITNGTCPIEIPGVLKLGAHVDLAASLSSVQQDLLTNSATSASATNTVNALLVSEAARLDTRINNIIDAGDTLDQVSEVVAAFSAADNSVLQQVAALQTQLSALQAAFDELTAE